MHVKYEDKFIGALIDQAFKPLVDLKDKDKSGAFAIAVYDVIKDETNYYCTNGHVYAPRLKSTSYKEIINYSELGEYIGSWVIRFDDDLNQINKG